VIQDEGVCNLNEEGIWDDYVLYWMQSSQRPEHNHTLEYANDFEARSLVVFGLTDVSPTACNLQAPVGP
jgi:deoxyribodipyrimidine photolyase